MIELSMVFVIGFLSAALLALGMFPIVHRRATRLTTARLDQAIPASVQELRVEKDQMRAQVATSLRRLEISIDHLTKKNVAHQTEITKKTERLASLQDEVTDKTSKIDVLEEKNRHLQDECSASASRRDVDAGLILEAQRSLADSKMELGRLTALASEQRLALAERESIVDEMRRRLQKSETLIAALQKDLSLAQAHHVSVTALHREIDRLESRIQTMTDEFVD